MIALSTSAAKPEHWLHLSAEFRADLSRWQVFCLPGTIGACHPKQHGHRMKSSPRMHQVHGDAGAIWQNCWLQLARDNQWLRKSIAVKELIPIVLARAVWGDQWQNKEALVKCGNMSVVQVITALTSRDPLLMHLLQLPYFYLAFYNSIFLPSSLQHPVEGRACPKGPQCAVYCNLLQVFCQWLTSPTEVPRVIQDLLGTDHQVWLSPTWRALLRASFQTV